MRKGIAACLLVGCVSDAGTPDSGVDASTDAAIETAADAKPSTWCTTQPKHLFCADFDGVAQVTDGWTSKETLGTGSLSLDNTQFVSMPNCASSTFGAVADGGGPTDAILTQTIQVTATTPMVHTEWDMRTSLGASIPAPAVLVLFQVYLNAMSAVQVGIDSTGWFVTTQPGSVATRHAVTGTPASNAWVHYTLDVTFTTAATGSVKLQMTSGDAGTTTLIDLANLQTTTEASAQTVSLNVGVVESYSPSPSYQARYDDVVLDVQ